MSSHNIIEELSEAKNAQGKVFSLNAGNPGASTTGFSKGAMILDTTNGAMFINQGTASSPSWSSPGGLSNTAAQGTTSTQLNYVFNTAVNSIQGATTSGNVWGNTISGGGNAAQPNLIRGDTSLRTIAGGYDNIIGRDAVSFPGDNNATIATQILGGAHNRIFFNGDTSQANSVAVNNGATQPSHGTIAGGSYHQIRNGDYGFIGGGTNSVIQEKSGFADVADGQGAFIGGGYYNICYGRQSVIAGGNSNVNECINATIGGGLNNKILTPKDNGSVTKGGSTIGGGSGNTINCSGQAVICGGEQNSISSASVNVDWGLYGFIGGGVQNTIATSLYSPYSVICGGFQNTVNNQFSTVVGGRANSMQSLYCTGIGWGAKGTNYGAFVHGGSPFSTAGDAQSSVYVLKVQTSNNTATALQTMDQSLTIPSDSAWAFKCLVVARATASNLQGAYEVTGLVSNDAGTAALVGTPTVTTIAEDAGAAAWNVTVNVSGATLQILGTGATSTTINWVGRLELAEVTAA